MSTRCFIAKMGDTEIRAVYSHWDGYPEGVGQTLQENYQDEEKIDALLDLGDLSSLGPEIGEEHSFSFEARPGVPTNEQAKGMGWTTFYGRDRGEKDTEAKVYRTMFDLERMLSDSWAEWVYVRNLGEWFVAEIAYVDSAFEKLNKEVRPLRPLSEVLS